MSIQGSVNVVLPLAECCLLGDTNLLLEKEQAARHKQNLKNTAKTLALFQTEIYDFHALFHLIQRSASHFRLGL